MSTAINAQLPQLNIAAGQTINLPARTYQYSSINIQQGGKLVINDNSQTWCILYCTGNITIKGSIIFRKFYSTKNPINSISPNGEQLTYTYTLGNVGGNGGNGGEGSTSGFPNRGLGGIGANGTSEYGGGAGSGAAVNGYPNRQQLNGNNGNGSTGGRRQLTLDGDGGDGSLRGRYSNGGLLFIYCQGDFDGANGEIHLEGEIGQNGKDGIQGTSNGTTHGGGGGGGGGAPGGEGGKLIIRTKGNYLSYPSTFLEGGKGGIGGQGKNNDQGVSNFSPPLRAGDNGQNGEDGASGLVDYLK